MRRFASFFGSCRRTAGRLSKLTLAKGWILTHPRGAAVIRAERAWLIGGAVGRVYGDNSAALHLYLRRSRPDLRIYWVIDRDSPDVPKARATGPVLFRDEIGTYVRSLLAAVHVVSHGVHDVPGCASRLSRAAIKVRLGHGLTALKKTTPRVGHTNETANALFDLIPVCSEFERENKRKWGVEPARLRITGIPRFDTLLARQRQIPADPKNIVYMPTWRGGKFGQSAGEHEAFLRGLTDVLCAPTLHKLLQERGASLRLVLHRLAGATERELAARLRGTPVELVSISDPQSLFVEAGLLITDYSSVAWDMLYLDKPVLFYQFDAAEYADARGGYISYDASLPGPVVRSAPELFNILETYLSGDFATRADYQANVDVWQERAFAYRDDRNSERVTAEIMRLLEQRSPESTRKLATVAAESL